MLQRSVAGLSKQNVKKDIYTYFSVFYKTKHSFTVLLTH